MPPALSVLIFQIELGEGDNGVLERASSEWSAFQITILNVDVVVELRVARTADHREEEHVLIVDGWVSNLEPELDRILAGPHREGRGHEANETLLSVQVRRHVTVIARDSVKNLV